MTGVQTCALPISLSILGFTGAATLIAGVIFIIGGYSRLSKARQLAKRGELPEQIDPEEADPAEAAGLPAGAADRSAGADRPDEAEPTDGPDGESAQKNEP